MKKRDKTELLAEKSRRRAEKEAKRNAKKQARLERKAGRTPGKKRHIFLTLFLDNLFILAGCALYGAGLNMFLAHNGIVLGGLSGLAVILNHLFPFLPIGTTVLVMNIPLFIITWFMFGKKFLAKTMWATVIFSVLLDVFAFLPKYTENTLLATIFGGVLCGVGLGLVYARGILTGGTDIIAKALGRVFPGLPMGTLLLIVDATVILLSGLVYRNVTAMLFSVVAIYLSSQFIDTVLSGPDKAKTAIIVSGETDSIKQAIIENLKRTATVIKGSGAYRSQDTNVLLCVVRSHELLKLKTIVHENDPAAFFIVVDATEVMGEGYKRYSQN